MPANSTIPQGVLPVVADKCADTVKGCPGKVRNVWGYASFPDHNNKRCIDFMIYDRDGGDRVARYLINNADRLGLKWLIWNRRIYRHQSSRGHGWGNYSGSNPHTDHVHAEFDDNPINRGSNDQGEEKDKKGRHIRIRTGPRKGETFKALDSVSVKAVNQARKKGSFYRVAWYVQGWLAAVGYDVAATGFWGDKTQKYYDAFRRSCGWEGDAAKGSVGRQSLTKLQAKAEKRTKHKITD